MLLDFTSSELVNHLVKVVKLFSVSFMSGLPGAWLVEERLKLGLHVRNFLLVSLISE